MAFEAFLSRDQGPSRAQRGATLLISICAHVAVMLGAGALVARATAVVGPRPQAQLASNGPRVPVRLWNAATLPGGRSSAASTPSAAAAEASPRRMHAGHVHRRRHPRPESPTLSTAGEHAPDQLALAALTPPPIAPPELVLAPAPEAPPPSSPAAAAPSVAAEARPAAPAPAGRAPPMEAQVVPTAFAAGLRTYDYFPRLPRSLARKGHQYVVLVDVCVSAQGKVDDIVIKEGSAPELDQVLREAILTWSVPAVAVGQHGHALLP
jgi:hypothetical protein